MAPQTPRVSASRSALPFKAGLVGDAPASPVHVEARAFALLPHRVQRHAADALRQAELINRCRIAQRGEVRLSLSSFAPCLLVTCE